MSGSTTLRLAAAISLAATVSPAIAQDPNSPFGFFTTATPSEAAPSAAQTSAAAVRGRDGRVVEGNVFRLSRTNAGAVARQTGHVSTGCLKPELLTILRRASNDFGSEAVVTSGFRRGRGYHAKCMAADVQIAGVSPGTLARYFRSQPGVGGVGTYGHTRSVHVDVAPRKYSWHGRSSRRMRVADACPCCGGAQHGARSAIACERSVIAPDALKLGNART
jgi:uncharacterized protein YcbK (DUF882 family)